MTSADTHHLDAIDLKITLTGADVDRACRAFDLAGTDAWRFQVFFCELPSWGRQLTLLDSGLIMRLRAYEGRPNDSTITLRPCRPARVSHRWIRHRRSVDHEFRMEGDWSGRSRVVAASLVHVLPRPVAAAVLDRSDPVQESFSGLQREFLAECADVQPRITDLQVFGPVDAHLWAIEADGLSVAVERWTVALAGIDFLELSVRTAPPDAGLVEPALTALALRRGLDPGAMSGSKTRAVLARLAGSHPP